MNHQPLQSKTTTPQSVQNHHHNSSTQLPLPSTRVSATPSILSHTNTTVVSSPSIPKATVTAPPNNPNPPHLQPSSPRLQDPNPQPSNHHKPPHPPTKPHPPRDLTLRPAPPPVATHANQTPTTQTRADPLTNSSHRRNPHEPDPNNHKALVSPPSPNSSAISVVPHLHCPSSTRASNPFARVRLASSSPRAEATRHHTCVVATLCTLPQPPHSLTKEAPFFFDATLMPPSPICY